MMQLAYMYCELHIIHFTAILEINHKGSKTVKNANSKHIAGVLRHKIGNALYNMLFLQSIRHAT